MSRISLLGPHEPNPMRVERWSIPLDSHEPFVGKKTLAVDLQGMLPLRMLVAGDQHAFALHSLIIDGNEQLCMTASASLFSQGIYLPRGNTLTLEIENVGVQRLAWSWMLRWYMPHGRKAWVRGFPWRRRRAPRETVVYPLRFMGCLICEKVADSNAKTAR